MPPYPYDHQFRKLIALSPSGEGEELFAELLRLGPVIREPLLEFLRSNDHDPEVAVLVELLAKSHGHTAKALLLNFLESPHARLRRSACNAMGWIRAREALTALDRIESEDADPVVRAEARAAIDEILKDWPGLVGTLQHHEMMAGAHGPRGADRLALVLPRLLALRYNAAPLGMTSDGKLRIAVRQGNERRLMAPLEILTGREIVVEAAPDEVVLAAIEKTYHHGDDDFVQAALEVARAAIEKSGRAPSPHTYYLAENLFGSLTPTAIEELSEEILAAIRPEEPCCPFDEATDAVEGLQSLVAQCCQQGAPEARITVGDGNLLVTTSVSGTPQVREVGDASFVPRVFALIGFLLNDSTASDPTGLVRHGRLKAGPSANPITLELQLVTDSTAGPLAILRFPQS
ncbi:hypothetical protein GC173_02355 [bacterium]|nr:hypothetical protein [bacterium]